MKISVNNVTVIYNATAQSVALELLTYYVSGIGVMIICCLGIIGNLLSAVVLWQETMRSSTYSYLAALSLTDTAVLIFTMILGIRDIIPKTDEIIVKIFAYLHPSAITFQVASIWLTLAFTVDRYIMICHPFRSEPYCKISRARKVITCLVLASIIYNVPKWFEYHLKRYSIPPNNGSQLIADLTDFGKSQVFKELYHSWFYFAFVCGLPFLSLAILNVRLIYAVKESRRRGREINAAEKKRNDTTVMLIGVVVIFFICQMPALVSRCVWAFIHDEARHNDPGLYTLNEISNVMVTLNSAINIVPYYFFGRRFRREFIKLFCRCLQDYSDNPVSLSNASQIKVRPPSNDNIKMSCKVNCKKKNFGHFEESRVFMDEETL